MGFREEFEERQKYVGSILERFLPDTDGLEKKLTEAMRYSVLSGGKKLRPLFMYSVYTMFEGEDPGIEPFMAAIEMIHSYSLVHDDLPAMDNDRLRHGKPSTWDAYGEGMGILVGDALLTLAFQTAAGALALGADSDKVAACIWILAEKAGTFGMCGGQALDLEYTGIPVPEDMVIEIDDRKTGALLQAAFFIGACLAGASQEESDIVETVALLVGRAFQIQDDILDVAGDPELLGKPVNSDDRNQKMTYVTRYGLDSARAKVRELSDEAVRLLSGLGRDSEFLEKLILMLADRSY